MMSDMNTQPELTDEQVSALMDKYRANIAQIKNRQSEDDNLIVEGSLNGNMIQIQRVELDVYPDPNGNIFFTCDDCGVEVHEDDAITNKWCDDNGAGIILCKNCDAIARYELDKTCFTCHVCKKTLYRCLMGGTTQSGDGPVRELCEDCFMKHYNEAHRTEQAITVVAPADNR